LEEEVKQLAAVCRLQELRKAFCTVAMHLDLYSQISEKYWYEHWVNIGVNMAKKKESYRERWLREHPRISLYLRKEEYERLKSLAESRGVSIKELILSLVEGFEKYYEDIEGRAFEEGYEATITDFVEEPQLFYRKFKELYLNEEPLFYTYPCSVCGQTVVSNHRSESAEIVRKVVIETLKVGGDINAVTKL
jgi:hypothetical protein